MDGENPIQEGSGPRDPIRLLGIIRSRLTGSSGKTGVHHRVDNTRVFPRALRHWTKSFPSVLSSRADTSEWFQLIRVLTRVRSLLDLRLRATAPWPPNVSRNGE